MIGLLRRRESRRVLVLLAVVAQAALLLTLAPGSPDRTATLEFTSAVGIYEGSDVRLLGVVIGQVTGVDPGPESVTVSISYDSDYNLPAGVQAVIVAPSVIADRFVQLTPAYPGTGPLLADGAVVPVDRTRTPVELDQVFSTMNQLLVALGPRGANHDGALNQVLTVAADDLRGQGPALRRLLSKLGNATDTLGDLSPDLFGTLTHLAGFTRTLARDDGVVNSLYSRLDDVASYLAQDRHDLGAVLRSLAVSLGEVRGFVHDNRQLLNRNVAHLTRVGAALSAEQEALDGLLRVVPVALNNLNRVWDPEAQGIRSRPNLDQVLKDLDGLICDAIVRAGIPVPATTCHDLLGGLS